MKYRISLIPLMLTITVSIIADDNVASFAYDKYIVQNVGSGLYWGAGNDWGVRASLIANPEFVKFDPTDMPNGQYKLESQVNNGGTQYYFNGNYMDQGSPVALAINKLPNGNFTIANATDGGFYGYDGNSTVLGKGLTNADDPNAQWTIVTLKEAKEALANATEVSPMNANLLFDDLNFGRNNRYYDKWTFEARNNNNGGNPMNYCVESFHALFNMSQSVEAPNGVYAITAQGFYRQDGSDNENLPVFFANEETQTFPLKTGSENSMNDASNSFTNGRYTIDPIYVEVTDGTLNIGAKLKVNTELWCVWDNFQITYYGGSGNITFRDENIKKLCIANWDKNGDGELDKKEAAIVTDIGDKFKGNKNITSFSELLFFTGITSIDDEAFAGCANLTDICIPRSVIHIGNETFSNCNSLNRIFVSPFNKKYIDDNSNSIIEIATNKLIVGCKSSIIPKYITSIGHAAFKGCKELTSITIPRNVVSIENSAFEGCIELSKVNSKSLVPNPFGDDAFSSISPDCILIIPKGTKENYIAAGWTENIFKGGIFEDEKNISFVDINVENICLAWDTDDDEQISYEEAASVTDLVGAFTSNTHITSFDELQYFTGLTSISDNMFSGCSGLTSVRIPSSVASIGKFAFEGCYSLASLILPDDISTIGNNAFPSTTSLYVKRGVKTLLTLWNKGYVEPYETGTTNVLTPSTLSLEGTTQMTATVKVNSFYPEFTNTLNDEKIESDSRTFNLRPEYSGRVTLKVSKDDVVYTPNSISFTTKSLNPTAQRIEGTASSMVVKASYTEGDANVTAQKLILNGVATDGDMLYVNGLRPNTNYYATYTVKIDDEYEYTKTISLWTDVLKFVNEQPKVISEGNVVVVSQSNLDDAEESVGFQWRRTDWTEEFASNSGRAFLYEGLIEGYIRNLNTSFLWKFRPYYQSADGAYFFGEWLGIDPTNTSYFEPTVHTYNKASVKGNTAEVKGYAQRGTDNISQQGFKYWTSESRGNSEAMNAPRVPSYAQTIESSGTVMEAELKGLYYDTEYYYVAFVKTSEGEIYYGEAKSFRTGLDPTGIEELTIDNKQLTVEEGVYDLSGRKLNKMQKGINIIRFSDGSTKKVLNK